MTDDRKPIWNELWSEARKAKEQRRAENRANWARSPQNAANKHKDKYGATAPEITDNGNGTGGSRSLAALRAIMGNVDLPLYRRIDASEIVLAYELGPGSAVGADPNTIGAASYLFLNSVLDAPGVPEQLRFRCLKLVASVENARARITSSAADHESKKQLLISLCNAERIRHLRQAGAWHRVVERNEPWFLKVEDDVTVPPGWFDSWQWPPPAVFAAEFERHTDVAAFREQLISTRARNRSDLFETLLAETPSAAEPRKD
jgi:hypothetical protein